MFVGEDIGIGRAGYSQEAYKTIKSLAGEVANAACISHDPTGTRMIGLVSL